MSTETIGGIFSRTITFNFCPILSGKNSDSEGKISSRVFKTALYVSKRPFWNWERKKTLLCSLRNGKVRRKSLTYGEYYTAENFFQWFCLQRKWEAFVQKEMQMHNIGWWVSGAPGHGGKQFCERGLLFGIKSELLWKSKQLLLACSLLFPFSSWWRNLKFAGIEKSTETTDSNNWNYENHQKKHFKLNLEQKSMINNFPELSKII